ncbi:hypothetical protein [Nitrososphaera sp.]|uniref:hypothetical protein n=1 Tax=Nitrososphaera sp. TaxID=1971748 RepID=UPI00307FB365
MTTMTAAKDGRESRDGQVWTGTPCVLCVALAAQVLSAGGRRKEELAAALSGHKDACHRKPMFYIAHGV